MNTDDALCCATVAYQSKLKKLKNRVVQYKKLSPRCPADKITHFRPSQNAYNSHLRFFSVKSHPHCWLILVDLGWSYFPSFSVCEAQKPLPVEAENLNETNLILLCHHY